MGTLFTGARVRTPQGWLDKGYVRVESGRIAALGAGEPPAGSIQPGDEVLDAGGMALLPGLANAHTHLSQTFMRGLAAGRPLLRWLKELIWPLQAAMSVEQLELAALLGLAENIRCGATAVTDHQKICATPEHTRAVVAAARRSGLRVCVARAWADRGSGAEDPAALRAELEALFDLLPEGGRVTAASGPLTPWRCSGESMQALHALALDRGAFTHIHVSETQGEVQMTLDETGLRPVTWLDRLGLLGPACQIVHAVWVDEAEIDLLAARRAAVVHCPISNMVMGSGIAPVKTLRARGVSLRLGTDGPASNDTQDGFENLKAALMLARVATLDAAALSPADCLEMATAGAVLAQGAPADLILVRLETLRAAPLHDPDSALALSTHGGDVDSVMVAGEFLMRAGKLTTLDEEILLKESAAAVRSLRRKAGLD